MKRKRAKPSEEYKKFRLKQAASLAKYCLTLIVLAALIIWAPNQAGQFTGYLGAFILGGTRLKTLIGL